MAQFPNDTSASGIWTLKKQKRAIQGENWPNRPRYIEEVFSTFLYAGNGSTQTITNGIDLSTKGGMVWNKSRSNAYQHCLTDTARGVGNSLDTSDTAANDYSITRVSAFNADGFTMGGNSRTNASSATYASWTFRKQPKFFDVVTYTGNGAQRNIAHSLGSAPGSIFVKRTDSTGDWAVWHRSLAAGDTDYLLLNNSAAKATDLTYWYGGGMTSTTFAVGTNANVNASGGTYVAYLFAHDAGGFGPSGVDNAISCGSYTTDASGNATVTLGYEPQWVLVKKTTGAADNWWVQDIMRGMPVQGQGGKSLNPNTSSSEASVTLIAPTATGFVHQTYQASSTFIYIAIRRGPMRTPTSGTTVYSALAYNGDQTNNRILSQGTAGPADLFWFMNRNFGANSFSPTGLYSPIYDRLRGVLVTNNSAGIQCRAIATPFTNAEGFCYSFTLADTQTDFSVSGAQGQLNWTNSTVLQMFRRAPGFFDEVCYTGDGTANRSVSHNLGVSPELVIIKGRNATPGNADSNWSVNTSTAIATATGRPSVNYVLFLNGTSAWYNWGAPWFGTASLTSTTFPVTEGSGGATCNGSGTTYVAYLFASCPGVSKVGSYTGNGSSQTINCGFTGGARFVMIKRTDSTGDWYVWDTARGIVASNDPHLSLNGTAAEVTTDDSVDADSSGFVVNQVAATNINVNAATYIFLAVA